MTAVPTTPPSKYRSQSKIPSPNLTFISPEQYKSRKDNNIFSPPNDRDCNDIPEDKENTHLTSFYKGKILELNKLQEKLFIKKSILDNLKDELSEKQQKYDALQFHWETLNGEELLKIQKIKLRDIEIEKIKMEFDNKHEYLRNGHELHMKQIELNDISQRNTLQNEYTKNLETSKFLNAMKFQKERENLLNEVEGAKNDIRLNDLKFEEMSRDIENSISVAKGNWLEAYQSDWKRNVELNDFISREINELTKKTSKSLQLENTVTEQRLLIKANEFKAQKTYLEQIQKTMMDVEQNITSKNEGILAFNNRKAKFNQFIEETSKSLRKLNEILIHEETLRRKMHNDVQELRGNIRVYCRVRSFPKEPQQDRADILIHDFDSSNGTQTINVLNKRTNHSLAFKFDRVFAEDDRNCVIFGEIKELVQSSLDGHNVCIFAYGQTGSGKTYTMFNEDDGVVPSTLRHICEWIAGLKIYGWEYSISLQYVEIHNDVIIDLLRDDAESSPKHEIRHNETNATTEITNVKKIHIDFNQEEIIGLIQKSIHDGNRLRNTARTMMNERSSRSHSICTIELQGTNNKTNEKSKGILNLVDLAGSERIKKSISSASDTARLRETQNINKSLSSLGDVIHALKLNTQSHIPFRNSKLTYLLKYSLLGSSKTLMFVNVSPLSEHTGETVNSLRFAAKVNATG